MTRPFLSRNIEAQRPRLARARELPGSDGEERDQVSEALV
jgi:hypothetical protein